METRSPLEILASPRQVEHAETAETVTRGCHLASIRFRLVAKHLQAGFQSVLQHRAIFEKWRHQLGILLRTTAEHTFSVDVHRKGGVAECSEFTRNFFFEGTAARPSVHNQHAGSRAETASSQAKYPSRPVPPSV